MKDERQRFLAEVWPKVHATMQRLGLSPSELSAKWRSRSERTLAHPHQDKDDDADH